MIKPLKERLQIYLLLFLFSIAATVALLFSGYDYRRNQGFFLAEDREPMSFGEVLLAFPKEYLYILLGLVGVVAFVELLLFITQRVFQRD